MPTKFINILETSKLRIRGQYLDSVSYVLLHFLTLRLWKSGPWSSVLPHHLCPELPCCLAAWWCFIPGPVALRHTCSLWPLDGSSCPAGAAVGYMVGSPIGRCITCHRRTASHFALRLIPGSDAKQKKTFF